MNSEKVKEIKEKLKKQYYYLDQAYSDHLAYGGKGDDKQEEEIYFLRDVLTLINEFESENERLRKERDVWVGKKIAIAERPKTKEYIVAPIYVMPNVETPAMMLKLGEKNLLQQFAKRLKEKCEYNRKQYCCEATVSFNDIDETLKEFLL